MFGLRRGHQPKKEAHEVAGPPYGSSSIKNGVYEPKIHIDRDITEESAERIAEALRLKFGEGRIIESGTIDFDEEEYNPIKGIAFAGYDLFERRLELLDRLIEIDKRDIPFAGCTDYGEYIRLLVDALMKDCDIRTDGDSDDA